jgi:AraC-like DNA-binding protein
MVTLDHGGAGLASARVVPPPPDLAPFLEHISVQDGRRGASWWVVPDANPHLIAAVTEDGTGERRVRLSVVGPRHEAAEIDTSRRVLTVAARLRPGALAALLRQPVHELADRALPACDMWPAAVFMDLEIAADAPADVHAHELQRLLRRLARRADCARVIDASLSAQRVSRVAAAHGLSLRAVHRHLLESVGLAPKRTLRIVRLHAALRRLNRPGASMSDAAHAAGYADQAHFSRECRALIGRAPSAWLALRADSFKRARPGAD